MNSNQSMVTYFIIKGLSDVSELQAPIFIMVLLIYLITISANMMVFLLICSDPQLQSPMYFFLANLSVIDIISTSAMLYKPLTSFILGNNLLSLVGCLTQFYIFSSLTGDELLILTIMSYDRYVAICDPLRYTIVMNFKVCVLLVFASWAYSFLEAISFIVILSNYNCYLSKEINHFFCDIVALLKLTCNDTFMLDLVRFVFSTFIGIFCSVLTLIPYIFIIGAIIKIHTNTGRQKAFYTCSSHLTVVILFYLTLVLQYLTPTSDVSLDTSKCFSFFNTAAVPLLNPLIYSLKNEAVKSALRRRFIACKKMIN